MLHRGIKTGNGVGGAVLLFDIDECLAENVLGILGAIAPCRLAKALAAVKILHPPEAAPAL